MNTRAITLEIPLNLLERFQQTAQESQQPVEEILLQTLQGNAPPTIPSVPRSISVKLQSLQKMSDAALWKIARSRISANQQERYEYLLDQNRQGILTSPEAQELEQLAVEADELTVQKAYAYALLRWRGYPIPTLDSLSQA